MSRDKDLDKLQEYHFQTRDIFDTDKSGKILILGIGNYLLGDEGVGVHAIHQLARMELPDYVDILDGATGSFELLPILAAYKDVVLIDATMDGQPPGSINVLYPRFAADFPKALSSHDIGLKDLFDALEFKEDMPRVILITVTIKEILAMRTELSEQVKEGIPKAADMAIKLTEKINRGEL